MSRAHSLNISSTDSRWNTKSKANFCSRDRWITSICLPALWCFMSNGSITVITAFSTFTQLMQVACSFSSSGLIRIATLNLLD